MNKINTPRRLGPYRLIALATLAAFTHPIGATELVLAGEPATTKPLAAGANQQPAPATLPSTTSPAGDSADARFDHLHDKSGTTPEQPATPIGDSPDARFDHLHDKSAAAAGQSARPAEKNMGHPAMMHDAADAEARITALHDKLAITPGQEEMWRKVATIMRDNAVTVTQLAMKRSESAKTMTAVDNLDSYAEISGAHETGTRNLLPAFKALYNGMPDAQKHAADAVFRDHGRGGQHMRHRAGS